MQRSRHALVATPPFGGHMARALTLALLLLLPTASAFGQYVSVIAACTRDVTKFCDAANPQRNFPAECIESHFQDFHEQCRRALVQTAAVREACKADIEQQCPTARPGAGRILLCMKKHFAALGQSLGRDWPRGRAQSWVLLSIAAHGSGYSISRLPVYSGKRGAVESTRACAATSRRCARACRPSA